jgi:lysozyme
MKTEIEIANLKLSLSPKAISILKQMEGSNISKKNKIYHKSYLCPAGKWTIGFGHVITIDNIQQTESNCSKERIVEFGWYQILEVEAMELLRNDLVIYENQVRAQAKRVLIQHEFDALVLFTYNCWYSEQLWLFVNFQKDPKNLSWWWQNHWCTIQGVKNKGLLKRRRFEFLLYSSGWLFVSDVY